MKSTPRMVSSNPDAWLCHVSPPSDVAMMVPVLTHGPAVFGVDEIYVEKS